MLLPPTPTALIITNEKAGLAVGFYGAISVWGGAGFMGAARKSEPRLPRRAEPACRPPPDSFPSYSPCSVPYLVLTASFFDL